MYVSLNFLQSDSTYLVDKVVMLCKNAEDAWLQFLQAISLLSDRILSQSVNAMQASYAAMRRTYLPSNNNNIRNAVLDTCK